MPPPLAVVAALLCAVSLARGAGRWKAAGVLALLASIGVVALWGLLTLAAIGGHVN